MSTTSRAPDQDGQSVEVLTDEEAETVTFVADFDRDSIVPPTEWITVRSEDLVEARR